MMTPPLLSDDLAYYAQLQRVVAGRGLPQMLIDLDRLEANAAQLLQRAGGLPIRLGTKSIRCVDVLRRVMALSPRFQGLLCYGAREAAWLAGEGFDDLLVAYPTLDPVDLAAAAAVVAGGKRLTLMIDSIEHCAPLAAQARALGVRFRVALDIDMSSALPGLWFGVRRSPLRDAAAALTIAERIRAQADALQLVGVMGYEAQIAGLADAVPGAAIRNRVLAILKRRSVFELQRRRQSIVDALQAAGHRLEFVNGGGTGSLESTATDRSVTEVAVGSGLYAPGLFDHFRQFRHHAAACFALQVVRRPAPGLITCAGGGYIASGAAGADRLPLPFLPPGMQLLTDEGAGEVQTPLRLPAGSAPALGDAVFLRHAKAGELAEHFESVLLFRGSEVVGVVPTYRGQQQHFF